MQPRLPKTLLVLKGTWCTRRKCRAEAQAQAHAQAQEESAKGLPLEPFSPEAGLSRTRSSQSRPPRTGSQALRPITAPYGRSI